MTSPAVGGPSADSSRHEVGLHWRLGRRRMTRLTGWINGTFSAIRLHRAIPTDDKRTIVGKLQSSGAHSSILIMLVTHEHFQKSIKSTGHKNDIHRKTDGTMMCAAMSKLTKLILLDTIKSAYTRSDRQFTDVQLHMHLIATLTMSSTVTDDLAYHVVRRIFNTNSQCPSASLVHAQIWRKVQSRWQVLI